MDIVASQSCKLSFVCQSAKLINMRADTVCGSPRQDDARFSSLVSRNRRAATRTALGAYWRQDSEEPGWLF